MYTRLNSIKDSVKEPELQESVRSGEKLTAGTKIPPNWSAFSLDNISKKGLLSLLKNRGANFQFPLIKKIEFYFHLLRHLNKGFTYTQTNPNFVESRGSTYIQKCIH